MTYILNVFILFAYMRDMMYSYMLVYGMPYIYIYGEVFGFVYLCQDYLFWIILYYELV